MNREEWAAAEVDGIDALLLDLCRADNADSIQPWLHEKAAWVRDGWRGEDRPDPLNAMLDVIEEILHQTAWDQLSVKQQSAHLLTRLRRVGGRP